MERPDSTKQLQDATHLLTMLEHLTDGLAMGQQRQEGTGRESIPWRGIRLTLGQARELIESALSQGLRGRHEGAARYGFERSGESRGERDNAEERSDVPDTGVPQFPRGEETPPQFRSLADRVQPAPTGGGRIRELGGEDNGARTQRGRAAAVTVRERPE